MTKHTAGQWRVIQEHGARLYTIVAPSRKVASVEETSDAQLIAAAPEMLKALQNLRAMMTSGIIKGDGSHDITTQIDRAIAKAERGE